MKEKEPSQFAVKFIDKHGFSRMVDLCKDLNRGRTRQELASRFGIGGAGLSQIVGKCFRQLYTFKKPDGSLTSARLQRLNTICTLLNVGKTQRQIARKVGITPEYLCEIVKSCLVRTFVFEDHARELIQARLHREEIYLAEQRKQFEAELKRQQTSLVPVTRFERQDSALVPIEQPKQNLSDKAWQLSRFERIFDEVQSQLTREQLGTFLVQLCDEDSSNWKLAEEYQLPKLSIILVRQRLGIFILWLLQHRRIAASNITRPDLRLAQTNLAEQHRIAEQ